MLNQGGNEHYPKLGSFFNLAVEDIFQSGSHPGGGVLQVFSLDLQQSDERIKHFGGRNGLYGGTLGYIIHRRKCSGFSTPNMFKCSGTLNPSIEIYCEGPADGALTA